jgi:hypothetical protein
MKIVNHLRRKETRTSVVRADACVTTFDNASWQTVANSVAAEAPRRRAEPSTLQIEENIVPMCDRFSGRMKQGDEGNG